MAAATPNVQSSQGAPAELVRFLSAAYLSSDPLLIRRIETWTVNGEKQSKVLYRKDRVIEAGRLMKSPSLFLDICRSAAEEKANIFFGVNPRHKGKGAGEYNLAWQIRTVRCLWADLD